MLSNSCTETFTFALTKINNVEYFHSFVYANRAYVNPVAASRH